MFTDTMKLTHIIRWMQLVSVHHAKRQRQFWKINVEDRTSENKSERQAFIKQH